MKIIKFNEFINEDKEVLLAPNGKPSNLNKKQWFQVRTHEFIEWFGDWVNNPAQASKVIDENGEPLVVYHGSKVKFDTFDVNKFKNFGWVGKGFYFSDNKKSTDFFGRIKYTVYLNIKNPFIVNGNGPNDLFMEVKKKYNIDGYEELNNVSEIIKEKGYDGVFFSHWSEGRIITCFNPNQIKSATNNSGDFSNSSNINESYSTINLQENKNRLANKNIYEDIKNRIEQEDFKEYLINDFNISEDEIEESLQDEYYIDSYLEERFSLQVEDGMFTTSWILPQDAQDMIDGDYLVLYHHTSSTLLPSILNDGLVPNKYDINRNGESGEVFLTVKTSGTDIEHYKRNAVKKLKGEPITIVVAMKLSEIEADSNDSDIDSGKYQYECSNVPPSRIIGIKDDRFNDYNS